MTTRTGRTPPTTTRTGRPKSTIWIDYLSDILGIVQDENGDNISIYADSGYEQIDNGTTRTPRPSI